MMILLCSLIVNNTNNLYNLLMTLTDLENKKVLNSHG